MRVRYPELRSLTVTGPGSVSTVRSPVYQFNETATSLLIEDLFYAASVHAFIMHQRIKLVFQ